VPECLSIVGDILDFNVGLIALTDFLSFLFHPS
jgi:hypothetical protein